MVALADDFDLGALKLSAGQGRRLTLDVAVGDLDLGGAHYTVVPSRVPATLDVSRMTGQGYSLRLRFQAALAGPCMRCLVEARPGFDVDAREIDQPGGGEELSSPYVDNETLDLSAWAHDALALALPAQILCREECAGLCPICAADLNEAGPEHAHERAPDPRWAKLRELHLE